MNTVCLIGNLTREPELNQAGETAVTNLRLAVNGRAKRGEEWVDVPNFFNVTAWGNLAERCCEYLEKGQQIAVVGRLQWREYESTKLSTSDGEAATIQSVEIVADTIDFLAKPKPRDEAGELVESA